MTAAQVIQDLEFRLAQSTAEVRAMGRELERLEKTLLIAQSFLTPHQLLGYEAVTEAAFDG